MLLEQPKELCVDFIGYELEVGGVMLEVEFIGVDDEYFSFVFIEYEIVVPLIESCQVVELHGLFVIASSFLNLCYECGYRFAQVYHEVGIWSERHHKVEEFHIGVVISVGEVSHVVVVLDEDIYSLEDRAVLYDCFVCFSDLEYIFEAFLKEIGFETKGPSWNVVVVVFEIGIEAYGFKLGFPSVVFGKHLGEGSFSCAYISSDGNMHRCTNEIHCKDREVFWIWQRFVMIKREKVGRREQLGINN